MGEQDKGDAFLRSGLIPALHAARERDAATELLRSAAMEQKRNEAWRQQALVRCADEYKGHMLESLLQLCTERELLDIPRIGMGDVKADVALVCQRLVVAELAQADLLSSLDKEADVHRSAMRELDE